MTADVDPVRRAGDAFTVLFVCTANRYRSPIAEHLLRSRTDPLDLGWRCGSAGTLARAGEPIDPFTGALLAGHGIDTTGWRARRLDAALVAGADLILAADSRHRAAVAMIDPRARGRTYLLLQFARLAGDAATGCPLTGDALVRAVRRAHSRVQPPQRGADELADPAGDPAGQLPGCAEHVSAAIDAIVRAAAGR